MKHIFLLSIVIFIFAVGILPSYGAGGLECINDELPTPMCTQPTPTQSVSTGFGASSSLGVMVNTATGNTRVSYAAGGTFPLGRPCLISHNSRDNRTFPMGIGRNHSYNVMLLERPDEWPETPVRVVLSNGGRVSFDQNLDGTYRGQPGVFSRLEKLADNSYRLYTNESPDMVDDGTVCYDFGPADATGRARLRSVTFPSGTMTFTYVTSGYGVGEVATITEQSSGLNVRFTYDYKSRVKTITSLDSVVTTFYYNAFSDMIQAVSSWGTLTFQVDFDHNIKTIGDGLGGHSAGITYVDTARCSVIRDTNGVMTDFNYTIDDNGSVQTVTFGTRGETPTTYEITVDLLISTATLPSGTQITYTYSADRCTTGSSTASLSNTVASTSGGNAK